MSSQPSREWWALHGPASRHATGGAHGRCLRAPVADDGGALRRRAFALERLRGGLVRAHRRRRAASVRRERVPEVPPLWRGGAMASRAFDAATVRSIGCYPSRARGGASVRVAAGGGWPSARRPSWRTSSRPTCPCASGCSRFLIGSGIGSPTITVSAASARRLRACAAHRVSPPGPRRQALAGGETGMVTSV